MKLMHNQNVPNPRIEAPGDWPDPKFPLCWETPLRYKHEIRRSITGSNKMCIWTCYDYRELPFYYQQHYPKRTASIMKLSRIV